MRTIGYLSQRGKNYLGFSGLRKCFSASAWMFLSFYNDKISTDDIDGFNEYFDDVEATVGAVGTGEEIAAKEHLTGPTSIYFDVQAAAIQKRMREGIAVDTRFPIANLPALVAQKPVIIRTYKLGGLLPGGHIILLVDYLIKGEAYCVNDPYGDAYHSSYQNANGQCAIYPKEFLEKYIDNGNGTCIILYAS